MSFVVGNRLFRAACSLGRSSQPSSRRNPFSVSRTAGAVHWCRCGEWCRRFTPSMYSLRKPLERHPFGQWVLQRSVHEFIPPPAMVQFDQRLRLQERLLPGLIQSPVDRSAQTEVGVNDVGVNDRVLASKVESALPVLTAKVRVDQGACGSSVGNGSRFHVGLLSRGRPTPENRSDRGPHRSCRGPNRSRGAFQPRL